MERLTKEEYWEESWKNIQLPAAYLTDHSHKIIAKKVISLFKKNDFIPEKIIELGGCPGRWPDFFNKEYGSYCDVVDYGKNNCEITVENYKMLGIKGEVYNQDLFSNSLKNESYDMVISDGLVEHFSELGLIFKKHVELLKQNGFLIIGVPNIKKSPFYNYFAKKDPESYNGHKFIKKEELYSEAEENNLEIIFCDYLGVFNPGLVHWDFIKNSNVKMFFDYSFQFINSALSFMNIKRESKLFSPYIFLVCKKTDKIRSAEENEKIWNFYQTDRREAFAKTASRFAYLTRKINKYKKGGRYLDIGVGDGDLIRQMASHGFECFGIDLAEESIGKNIQEFKNYGLNVNLRQGNISYIPFEDYSFDVITASEVLEHLDYATLKKGVKEVERCLKNGGIFVATVPVEENLKDNQCYCPRCGNVFHRWGHIQSFNIDKLKYIFDSKFNEVKIYKIIPIANENVYETIKYKVKWLVNLCIVKNSFIGNYVIIAKK